MLVYIYLCVLEHRLTVKYLLSFLVYSMRLPLLFIEQVLDVDRDVHLNGTRDLSGTNASRITFGTIRTLCFWKGR